MVTKSKSEQAAETDQTRYAEPKAHGGRTRQALDKDKYPPSRTAGLKPPWKPGFAPNPGGRPKQHSWAVAQLRDNGDLFIKAMLDIIQRGLEGRLTQSDNILSKHLEFVWQAAYGRHPQSVRLEGDIGVKDGNNPVDYEGTTSLLLRAAAAKGDTRLLQELREATARIEAEVTRKQEAHEASLTAAAVAVAEGRGDEVPGLTRLLLEAKAAKAKQNGNGTGTAQ